jgi:IMP dehydrogenase
MPAFLEGLSFDDVLLIPRRTEVLPSDVDISAQFLPGINIKVPIVSAPMDTVTDARLAIGIAREGGVGVIHRNMDIDRQAEEVDRVKRSEHGVITNPIKLDPEKTIQDALNLMDRFHISGVPIPTETSASKPISANPSVAA